MIKYITEQEWLDHFANVVRAAMERRGLTNKTLSEKSRLSEAAISRYVNARQMPNLRAVINLAYALQLSVDDLMDAGGRIR